MATGTIKQETWSLVNPVTGISGDDLNGDNLTWRLNGKTLHVYGYVKFSASDTPVIITLDTKYRVITQSSIYFSYSGWLRENQVWDECGANYSNNTFSMFRNSSQGGTYGKLDHYIMLA